MCDPFSSSTECPDSREGAHADRGWDNSRIGSQEDDGAPITSRAVASFLDAGHRGPSVDLTGINSLTAAGPDDLAFCVESSLHQLDHSEAGAIISPPIVGEDVEGTLILVENPRVGFAKAVNAFFESIPSASSRRVHSTACVHDDATIGEGTRIGPFVSVGNGVRIGSDCTIRAGTVVGTAGFGFARDDGGKPHRLPHRGSVRIEDGVEIGPNCSIDRAVFSETVIGPEVKLSGHVHVAHQVSIGRRSLVAFGAGFGGGAKIGERVMIHPHVGVAEGVKIGDGAEVGINSAVLADVSSGTTVVGSPARAIRRDADQPDGGQ